MINYRLTVFGNPIAHSLSPYIHTLFAQSLGINVLYDRCLVKSGTLIKALQKFRLVGGVGANVTLPLKEEALFLASSLSKTAKKAGSVNTLTWLENGWQGDNTDGIGLVEDILQQGHQLTGARILLIGAGGAARGVIDPILQRKPASFIVTNRTTKKAQQLAQCFHIDSLPLEKISSKRYDVIINATSSTLQGTSLPLDAKVFKNCQLAYDMMYGGCESSFLSLAKTAQVTCVSNGLGMLVYQAAASFERWTSLKPPASAVLTTLRETKSQNNHAR